jgi:ribosomal protein S18
MLIKPTESFTADLVIERALKQDIGPDATLGMKRKNFKLEEDLPNNYDVKRNNQLFDSKKPDILIRDDDYNYKENYLNKLKIHLNSEKTRPVSFLNPPMTRGQMRKKFMIHTIQSKDINWKNLPLLTRFLNDGGKILNRYQTRLPIRIHKKLSRTVKHARNMGLLPFSDFLKPYHKIPFTSIYNEFYEETSKVVDVNTGLIKLIHQPTDKDKFNYSSYDSAVTADKTRLDLYI